MATVAHNNHYHFGNMFGFLGPKPATAPVETPQLIPDKGAKLIVASEDRVDVVVGLNSKARTWKLHKDLLCQFSAYFAAAAKAGTEEALAGQFSLADQDPAIFALFVRWLYSTDKEIQIGGPQAELESTDPWIHFSRQAYELGKLLQSPKFSRFALVKFTQGIRFASPATLLTMYHDGRDKDLKEKCPLRRFNAAWLWYVRHTHALLWTVQSWWISEGDLADPVCGPLVKKMLKDKEFADSGASGLLDKAVDPHWLNIDHWFADCSDNPLPHNCSHVPFPCNMNGWGRRRS